MEGFAQKPPGATPNEYPGKPPVVSPPPRTIPQFEPGRLWLSVVDQHARPPVAQDSSRGALSGSARLDKIFKQFHVKTFTQLMPFARTASLRDVYEVACDCDAVQLKAALEKQARGVVTKIRRVEQPIALYDPVDYMWGGAPPDWLWNLRKIQANLAWDLTRGDPKIKIAVIDTVFDSGHPDLVTKMVPAYDPASGIPNTTCSVGQNFHGTATASVAAAETVDVGGTAIGQLASVGYKCGLLGYTWDNGLAKALHASTVMKADVISISWFSGCSPDQTGTDQSIIREILDNGTTIVASAGNGPMNCGGNGLFPFSATYDPRVIIATGTDVNDQHGPTGFSHYPLVDISAPAKDIMVAVPSFNSSWPYWGGGGGTSFAAPLVAGVVGLMRSVNRCLTLAEIETILKSTADPVVDAATFPNGTGAGRLNAYRAVLAAGEKFTDFEIDGDSSTTPLLCQNQPLHLNAARTNCANSPFATPPCTAPGYFVSVQLSDQGWNRFGPEVMRWLSPAEVANISDFDLRQFCGSQLTFQPGEYYRIKLAIDSPWREQTHLVYIRPAVSQVLINGCAGPTLSLKASDPIYVSTCATQCASDFELHVQQVNPKGGPVVEWSGGVTTTMNCRFDLKAALPLTAGSTYIIKVLVNAPLDQKQILLTVQ
jgi:subtilisin family serine protease